MTLTTLFLLAASAIGAALPAGQRPSVRVCVYTSASASGQPSADGTERQAAVQDMREALRKKSGILLVDDRAQADVLVEVIGRERRESPDGGFGGKTITQLGDTIIRLHVSSGEDQADLKGIGRGTWARAAKDASDRLAKWIARRHPQAATR